MLKRLRKTHTSQLSIGFMNTCTHKPTQEIYVYTLQGEKSFHSIIYITPAAIPINNDHTHTHTPTEQHTQKNTLANITWDAFQTDEFLASFWKLKNIEFFWEIKVRNSRQWGQKQRKIFCQRSPDRSEELKAETCQESAAFHDDWYGWRRSER